MEELAIFNCKFVYVKGEDNSVADALSRYPRRCASMAEAEKDARHPYQYSDEDECIMVGKIQLSSLPWNGVMALSTRPGEVAGHSGLELDKNMVDKMKMAYKED